MIISVLSYRKYKYFHSLLMRILSKQTCNTKKEHNTNICSFVRMTRRVLVKTICVEKYNLVSNKLIVDQIIQTYCFYFGSNNYNERASQSSAIRKQTEQKFWSRTKNVLIKRKLVCVWQWLRCLYFHGAHHYSDY